MNPEFEDWMWETFKPKTVQNTLRALRHLEKNGVSMDAPETFRAWIREMKKKGVLDRTLNTYIKPYNRFLTYSKKPKIKFFHESRSPQRPVATMDDYSKLLKAAETFGYTRERKVLLIEILFKTGARINECSSITVDDILDDRIRIIGKNQKEGKLYLPSSVRKALDRYLKVRKSRGSNRVFTNSLGEPISYDGLRNEIYQISKKAGIKFSAHRARRFYARFLYESGLDLEDIRLMMRHEKYDTTKIYIQRYDDDAISTVRNKKIPFFEGSNPNEPGTHETPRPGFEPESRARQARMIGRYTTEALYSELCWFI